MTSKLARIAADAEVDEPDGEFACPSCCDRPGTSAIEIALALELRHLFPKTRNAFLDSVRYDLDGDEAPYRPDLDLGVVFVEYDGFPWHKDKPERDDRRAAAIQRVTGRRVLRVRERTRGRDLPPLSAWCIPVNADATVHSKVAAILKELARVGYLPTGGMAQIDAYVTAGAWVTRALAAEERARMAGGRQDPRAKLRRLGDEGLLDAYVRYRHRWGDVATELGFKSLGDFSTVVAAECGLRPTEFAIRAGLPAHAPSAKRGALAGYEHLLGVESDKEIARRAGTSSQAVAEMRKAHKRQVPRIAPPRSVVAAYADLLGKVGDAEIAKMAGCNVSNVKQYRKKLGIGPAIRKRKVEVPVG